MRTHIVVQTKADGSEPQVIHCSTDGQAAQNAFIAAGDSGEFERVAYARAVIFTKVRSGGALGSLSDSIVEQIRAREAEEEAKRSQDALDSALALVASVKGKGKGKGKGKSEKPKDETPKGDEDEGGEGDEGDEDKGGGQE